MHSSLDGISDGVLTVEGSVDAAEAPRRPARTLSRAVGARHSINHHLSTMNHLGASDQDTRDSPRRNAPWIAARIQVISYVGI